MGTWINKRKWEHTACGGNTGGNLRLTVCCRLTLHSGWRYFKVLRCSRIPVRSNRTRTQTRWFDLLFAQDPRQTRVLYNHPVIPGERPAESSLLRAADGRPPDETTVRMNYEVRRKHDKWKLAIPIWSRSRFAFAARIRGTRTWRIRPPKGPCNNCTASCLYTQEFKNDEVRILRSLVVQRLPLQHQLDLFGVQGFVS